MAKYIDREKLPQFQFYRNCNGKDYGWEMGNKYIKIWHPDADGNIVCIEDDDYNLFELMNDASDIAHDRMSETEAFEKYVKPHSIADPSSYVCRTMDLAVALIHTMLKDEQIANKWEKRLIETFTHLESHYMSGYPVEKGQLLYLLCMIENVFMFAESLITAQGFPESYTVDASKRLFPKMLLIEDTVYKKCKETEALSIDYNILNKHLRDSIYVMTVNGESAERKMSFVLSKQGEEILCYMLDPLNGASQIHVFPLTHNKNDIEFVQKYPELAPIMQHEDEKALILISAHCHPRGEYDCLVDHPSGTQCFYCEGTMSCHKKMMRIFASVLYIAQEYFKRIENETASKRGDNDYQKQILSKPFIPKGMIRLYDIKMSKEEMVRMNKFASFSGSYYTSSEKSPHVRRGFMRYNPKTGRKDIRVSGSIIHKDRYNGFCSAERIVR